MVKRSSFRPTSAAVAALTMLALDQTWSFQQQARQRRRRSTTTTTCQAMEFATAASAIDSWFQTQPYMSAFLTCSFKASAADFVAQQQGSSEEEEEDGNRQIQPAVQVAVDDNNQELDTSRNLAFIAYGGLYQGLFLEFLYNRLFPAWFGSEQSLPAILMEVGIDNFLLGPFCTMPVAYAVKTAFTNTDPNASVQDLLRKGMSKYVEDVKERGLMWKYWGIWVPVQTMTFSVIPPQFRIVFVAMVSFFWVLVLSMVSAAGEEDATAAAKQES